MKSLRISRFAAHIRFLDLPGEEPVFVMLHGLGSASSGDFPAIARRQGLARYRFLLPDFFGFGFSDRPAAFDYSLESHAECIFEILRALGVTGIHLFGHSMGGAVAVALAAAHPEIVRRLVLAEANLDPGVGQASKRIAEQSEADYVHRGHARFLEELNQAVPEEPSLSAYIGAVQISDPVAMHRSSVGLIRGTVPSQRELFLSMKIPRGFIFSAKSRADPDVERFPAAGIRVAIVPDAGHAMMLDNPDGFTSALVKTFLEP